MKLSRTEGIFLNYFTMRFLKNIKMYYSKTYFENEDQRAFQKNTTSLSFYYCPSSKNYSGGLLPFYLLDNSIFDHAEQLDTDAIYELMKKAYKNDQVGFVKIFSSYFLFLFI